MALQVVNTQRRLAPGRTQGRGEALADQQGANQPRAGGIGDPVNGCFIRLSLGQRLPDQGQQTAHMVPGGQFRHHPPVGLVHRHLAVKPMRQKPARPVIDRDRGLIAGALDA